MTDETEYSPEELAALGEVPEDDSFEHAGDEQEPENELSDVGEQSEGEEQDEQEQSAKPDKKSKTVPHGAFHAKNEEAKRLKAELEQVKAQINVANERFARFEQERLQQTQIQPQPALEEVPGDDDPIGQIAYLKRELEQVKQRDAQAQEQAQLQSRVQEFQETLQQEEAQYAATNPDYVNATSFLASQIIQELQYQGYPPQHIRQAYQNQVLQMALNMKNAGRSVPEAMYELAKVRGYSAQQNDQVTPDLSENQETLDRIAQGQKASRNIASGEASASRMTLEKFTKMSEEESFAWMEKNPKAAERLFGSMR